MVIPVNRDDNPKKTAYDWHMRIVQDDLTFLKPPNGLRIIGGHGGELARRSGRPMHPLVVRRFLPKNQRMVIRSPLFRRSLPKQRSGSAALRSAAE